LRITGSQTDNSPTAVARRQARQDASESAQAAPTTPTAAQSPKKEEKKGLLRRIIGVFK